MNDTYFFRLVSFCLNWNETQCPHRGSLCLQLNIVIITIIYRGIRVLLGLHTLIISRVLLCLHTLIISRVLLCLHSLFETLANTLFMAFSISTSTLRWYIVRFTATPTQTKSSSHRDHLPCDVMQRRLVPGFLCHWSTWFNSPFCLLVDSYFVLESHKSEQTLCNTR